MKNRVLLCLLLLFSLGAWGQRVDSRVTTTTNPPPIGGYTPILAVPGSQITLCAYPANGVPCTNLATSYTDATLTTACPAGKPVVLQGSSACGSYTDQLGNFGFWVAPGCYTYTSQLKGTTQPPKAVCSGAGSTGIAGLATYDKQGLVAGGVGYVSPGIITTDAFAAINAVGATLPAAGGIIDATALGSNTYTVTTQLTALNNASQAIVLILNPQTRFIINTHFSSPSGASPATCAVPIGPSASGQPNGASGIITTGMNFLGGYQFQLGPLASVSDVICSGRFDGGQESMFLDGVGVEGNPSATMTSALIHLQGVFGPTKIINSGTSICMGNCLLVNSANGTSPLFDTGSGNMLFLNDVFEDNYTGSAAAYPGCVVNLDALTSAGGMGNLLFEGGIIQHNGPHNPLICMNGRGSVQLSVIKFENVYPETLPATTSSFWSNIDPIQLIDANQVYFDGLKPGGTPYAPDFIYIGTTNGKQSSYAIQIDSVVVANGYTNIINNTTEGTVETGYAIGDGDKTIPPYYSNLNSPFNRRTNSAPVNGMCTANTQGSGWYNSNGTTVATTAYLCSAISGTPTWTAFGGGGGGGAVTSVSALDTTVIVSPTTGAVTVKLNLGANNVWTGQQIFNAVQANTAQLKVVNGVSDCSRYSGADVSAKVNSCLNDALNKTNGNTTGWADARELTGFSTTVSQITVGDTAGDFVKLLLPCQGAWLGSMTGGTAYTVLQYGGSEIEGCPVSGISGNFGISTNTSSNLYAVMGIMGSSNQYVSDKGFDVVNLVGSGHVTASGDGLIINGVFADGSLLTSVNVRDGLDSYGVMIQNVCCEFAWEHSGVSADHGFTPMGILATSGSFIQGFSFAYGTIVGPGNGRPAVYCFDTRTPPLSDVTFTSTYGETATGDTTFPYIQIDGCRKVKVEDFSVYSNVSNSTAPIVQVTSRYNTDLELDGIHAFSGTGNYLYPLIAIVNNFSGETTNLITDNIGNFGKYNPPTVPSALGPASLGNGSTAVTQAVTDNTTKVSTTAFNALQFASPPVLGSTTPNQVNSTKVLVVNGTLTGFAGQGSATYTAGASAQVGTGATTPICYSNYSCNSIAGTVSFTTGTGSLAAGTIVTINVPGTRTNPGGAVYPPNCSVTLEQLSGTPASYGVGALPANPAGTVTIPITVRTALQASTNYIIHYGPCEGI